MVSNGNGYPLGWDEYVAALGEVGHRPPRPLAVWAARFRVAKNLSAIRLDGMSRTAEEGYLVGIKLTLVDTAMEALESALGVDAGSIGVYDQDLSFEFWNERLRDVGDVPRQLTNRSLKAQIEAFVESDRDACGSFNLRVLLRALRHLNSHGDFTPSSTGLYTSAKYRDLMLRLADAGLGACQTRFLDYREQLASGQTAGLSTPPKESPEIEYVDFLQLGALWSFSLTVDGSEMCARFPGEVPDLHIDFKTGRTAPCPQTDLETASEFIESIDWRHPVYGDLVRSLGLASHGTVKAWKVGGLGWALATEREFDWLPDGQVNKCARVPFEDGAMADFLRYSDLSLIQDLSTFVLPTDSGFMAIDITKAQAERVTVPALGQMEHMRFSSYLNAYVGLEKSGLGVSLWSSNPKVTSKALGGICHRLSKSLPQTTWQLPETLPKSLVAPNLEVGAVITWMAAPTTRVSLSTGLQEKWLENSQPGSGKEPRTVIQIPHGIAFDVSENVFVASGGYGSGLLMKLSASGELLDQLEFGESPQVHSRHLVKDYALVGDMSGSLAKLNVRGFFVEDSVELELDSFSSVSQLGNGDFLVAGFLNKQFVLLRVDYRTLETISASPIDGISNVNCVVTDMIRDRVFLGHSLGMDLLVWLGSTNGTPDRIPLPFPAQCAVINQAKGLLYVGYKDRQAVGVIDLNTLELLGSIETPGEIVALEITSDEQTVLALGSGFECSYLSQISWV